MNARTLRLHRVVIRSSKKKDKCHSLLFYRAFIKLVDPTTNAAFLVCFSSFIMAPSVRWGP